MSDNVTALLVSYASLVVAIGAMALTIYRDWRALNPKVTLDVLVQPHRTHQKAILRIVNHGPGPVSICEILVLLVGSRSPFAQHWACEPVPDPLRIMLRETDESPALIRLQESVFPLTLSNSEDRRFELSVADLRLADPRVRTVAVLDHKGRRHIVPVERFMAIRSPFLANRTGHS
jgi:hypothetical protein